MINSPEAMPASTLDRLLALLRSASREDLSQVSASLVDIAAADARAQLPDAEHLSQQMHQCREDTIGRVAELASRCCSRRVGELKAATPDRGITPEPPAFPFGTDDLERLSHLTLERILVHRAAPQIQLTSLAAGLPSPSETRLVVAVIFDYPLAIGHELYPLWTDALATGPIGGRSIEVIGVHRSWLDETCRATRAILYDAAADVFHEGPLPSTGAFDAAILLAQSPVAHCEISHRLQRAGIPHVNRYSQTAEIADDKWACFERWREAEVRTPDTCLLEQSLDPDQARTRVAQLMSSDRQADGWFIQPRHGTEAGGVEWVPASDVAVEQVLDARARIAPTDDTILRPRVGRLRLLEGEEPRSFDLRLHTCRCDGKTRAESGYLICAPTADETVVAASRGATILRLARLEVSGLLLDGVRGEVLTWSTQTLATACDLAAQAAGALDLDLAGVDLKLDAVDGQIVPIVLDVNPRPAGLLHADLIGTKATEPGVGATLWRRLAQV